MVCYMQNLMKLGEQYDPEEACKLLWRSAMINAIKLHKVVPKNTYVSMICQNNIFFK